MSGMQTVTAATISGALVFGMILALFGCLKLALARRLQLGDGQVRRLLLALNIALMPMVLLCGLLLDLCGARPILMAGSVALALALVSLSVRPEQPHAFAAILLAGLGAAALSTASTVLMPRAFFALEETSASLNLGYVFVALGALLTPVLTDLLLGKPVSEAMNVNDEFLALMRSQGEGEPDEDLLGDAVAFAGVSKYPARIKCALLSWMAWKDATAQAVQAHEAG